MMGNYYLKMFLCEGIWLIDSIINHGETRIFHSKREAKTILILSIFVQLGPNLSLISPRFEQKWNSKMPLDHPPLIQLFKGLYA